MSRRGNIAFDLSDSVDEVLVGVRSFVEAEVVPRHEQAADVLDDPRLRFGPDGLFSGEVLDLIRQVRTASAAAGYYTMFVPEAIGGGGLGSEALYRVWEDLYHRFGPRYWLMAWVVAHWARGPSHVLVHATPAARARVLPGLLSGETSMCFAMSEPDAGSDARMMRTRAVADGDDWIVSGSKIWISNGPYAEYAVVFARVDAPSETGRAGRISAFLVPTDSPGFSAEGSIRMFGEVGGDESLLHFDGVRVGADMVLGPIGGGFSIAMAGVTSGRLYNSARAVGLARWAIETATAYVKGREAFGRPVAEHQGVAFPLAESAMEVAEA